MMAQSSSSVSSSQRTKKPSSSSTLLAEGVTPRPRRRKQPTTSQSRRKGSTNTYNHNEDGDYSFLADENDFAMVDGNVKKSSGNAGRDKENEKNHVHPPDQKSIPHRDNLTTAMQHENKTATKKQQKNVDELSDAMAKVSLGASNTNNSAKLDNTTELKLPLSPVSEYTMSACPSIGYGTNHISVSTSDQLLTTLQNAIQILGTNKQQGEYNVDATTYKLLSKNMSLLEAIASSSHSLKSVQSILIEEHTTMLVDTTKKCLKALSSLTDDKSQTMTKTNKKSGDDLEMALLRVAMHTLRSLTPTLDYNESKSFYEIVIKLFYHCVVIAGDACHKKFQSFGNKKSPMKNDDDDVVVVLEYALLCLASYEGLGRLLYTTTTSNNYNDNKKKTKKDVIAWDEILPIPKIGVETKSNLPLPQKQLVKIALESSQCAASSLLYLSLVSLHVSAAKRKCEWMVPNEFHFASSVIHETCSGKFDGTPMFQKMLTNVTLPYVLHSLLETNGANKSMTITNIDGLRQVKKVYRILWDGARSIEEVGNASNSTTLRICSLNLYCEAILFILEVLHQLFEMCPDTSNLSDSDQSEIIALFDRASSSAMKAAAVFDKSSGVFASMSKGKVESASLAKSKKALLQFHNIVGTKLDLTRKCTSLQGGVSPVSASYFEYCTYRSVHLFRLTGKYILSSFSLKDERGPLKADDECSMAMWTFFVVDLSLQARHGLVNNNTALKMSEKDVELIISTFEKRIANASVTIQSRSRSMMLLPELHTEATKILSSTSDQIYAGKGTFLAVMGSILERCLAPVELMLARGQKEASRSLNYRFSSSDIQAKSALFYSIAKEVTTEKEMERFYSESDSQLRKSFDILMKILCGMEDDAIESNAQCISAVEMFAKIATYIGKRSISIQAQLFAVEILSKIAIKAASLEMFEKYQIYNRYMMLSSMMETSGHTRESVATMAVALWSVIEQMKIAVKKDMSDKEAAVGDSFSERVLLFPATHASSFESNETPVSFILTKLTRSYVELRQSAKNSSRAQDSSLSKCLDKTLIGKLLDVASSSSKDGKSEINDQLNLSKLLHYAIWNQKRYEVLSSSQLAEIVRQVLLAITKAVKRCISRENGASDVTASHLIDEARTFLQAQKKRVGDVTDRDVHQVISSSFHTYFAAILMESNFISFPRPSMWVQCQGMKGSDLVLLKQAYSQLQHADGLFSEDSSHDDSTTDACFFAQWAAIQFHQAVLMEHLTLGKNSCEMPSEMPSNGTRSFIRYNHSASEKYRSSLSTCGRALEMFDDELFPEVIQSLLLTLERLLYRFSLFGDAMASVESFDLLQQVCSLLSHPQRIMSSISAFVFASSNIEQSVSFFSNNIHFCQNIEAIDLDEKDEIYSDLIRHASAALNAVLHAVENKSDTSFEGQPVLELSNYVLDLIERVTSEDVDTDEVLIVVQIQAIIGRLYFLLSKVCLHMGKPLTALQFLCSCRQECKKKLQLLRTVAKCHDILMDGALEQSDDLQSICYVDMAVAFASMGVRRKAEDYAILAVLKRRILHPHKCQRVSQVNVQELVDLGYDLDGLDGVLHTVRTVLTMKFLSSSPDTMAAESLEFKSSLLPKMESFGAAHIHQFVSRSKTVLSYYDSLENIPSFQSKSQVYIDRACQGYAKLQQSDTKYAVAPITATHAELRLRLFRGFNNKTSSTSILNDVLTSRNAPEICSAQAQYELGLIALENARVRGELYALWHGYFVSNGKGGDGEYPPLQYTFEARKHFQSALSHSGPAATKFTKDLLRCLALTTGPEDTNASSFFIHASIGGNARATVLDVFSEPSESNRSHEIQDNVKTLFQMFDDETMNVTQRIQSFRSLLQDSASLLPDAWTVSSLAICPSGEILVSSIRKDVTKEGNVVARASNICIMQCDEKQNVHSELLIPLDRIIDRSQRQLHGMTEEAQTEQFNEESVRRKWWNERHKIDDDLRSLLEFAEAEFFGHSLLQEAFRSSLSNLEDQQCESSGDDNSSECSDFGPARLASRFEQVERELDMASLTNLTVAVLKERLASLGVASAVFQKMRKAELIDLLASEMERVSDDSVVDDVQETTPDMSTCIKHHSAGEHCTILILDEHLQRFPFESMDMFAGEAVTRAPSLPFVLATLMERQSLSVDPERISYVLDPESNLSETASNLGPALNNLASSRGLEWNGVTGEMPSPEFMSEILKREHGMFLYCGHGGGEKFFSRSQVEEIMVSRDDGIRGCRPTVVLMGCSSGKLQSVNVPKENPAGQTFSIYYEPEGIALSYLISGSPCVVGNLWDVTDRDIDRYCLTLMEDFVKGQGDSLAKCVAEARRACKLRYIVGSAPVCYGLPVKCSSS